MNRDEILSLYHSGPDNVVKVILMMQRKIEILEAKMKVFEEQLKKDSHNSNNPPSTDSTFKKKASKSLRKSSNKKSGGQKNHKGYNLKKVKNPHKIIRHTINNCKYCGNSLNNENVIDIESRQVFDIPQIEMIITEHQAESKTCNKCGQISKADFPEEFRNFVQYGNRIKALISYFSEYQLIPLKRIKEIFSDVFQCQISEGTIVNTNNYLWKQLESVEEEIKKRIIQSPVVHFDETGFRVESKLSWVHTASTNDLTYYFFHPKRGKLAMDEMGILPDYKGTATHDHWKAYFNYLCNHELCNVHHLRELIFIFEECNQKWANEMFNLLLEMKKQVEQAKAKGEKVRQEKIKELEDRYEKIIEDGFKENPHNRMPTEIKRGRIKKSKPINLLERLRDFKKETLGFLNDHDIPFSNNLAERDLRMIKVKLKISGTIRSKQGAKSFCRIRSYISTIKKIGLNVLCTIRLAFENNPMIFFNNTH